MAEARRQLRRQQHVIVIRRSVEQHQRTGVARGVEVREALAIALEEIILALVAPDDELEIGRGRRWRPTLSSMMSSSSYCLVPRVDQRSASLCEILFVGEEAAAAGWLGVVHKTVLRRQRHLRLAIAAVEAEELFAVHPAFALRQRLRQQFGAQRAQQPVEGAGLARHHRHGVLALRHRPLADDLAGDDEVEATRLHPLARLAHHEALAVEAGIQIRAVAVLGVDDDVLVLLDHVDDVQLDAELFRDPECVVALGLELVLAADGVRVALDAEAGVEVDALDVDALFENHLGGEHGIETAGDERDRTSLHRDVRVSRRRGVRERPRRTDGGRNGGGRRRNRYRHRDRADVRGDNGSPKAQVRHGCHRRSGHPVLSRHTLHP